VASLESGAWDCQDEIAEGEGGADGAYFDGGADESGYAGFSESEVRGDLSEIELDIRQERIYNRSVYQRGAL